MTLPGLSRAVVAPFMPYLIVGGLALLAGGGVGAYFWHGAKVDAAINAAVAANDKEWETEAARLRGIAWERSIAANDAATRSQASLDALAAQSRNDHATYYAKAGNDGACLSDSRVRAIEKAGAAAMETATAAR